MDNRQHKESTHTSRVLFTGLLLLIAWAPFPLGSNRTWAWAILATGIFLLGALWFIGIALGRQPMPRHLRRYRAVLFLLLAWLLFQLLQLMPLPMSLLEILSPPTAALYQDGSPILSTGRASVAVDSDASRAVLIQNSSYITLFFLALCMLTSRRRLYLLALTMVVTGLLQAIYGVIGNPSGDTLGLWRPGYFGHQSATGTFVNRNHFAANISMAISLNLGLLLASKPLVEPGSGLRSLLRQVLRNAMSPRALLYLTLAIMLAALVLSQSRGAIIALFIAVITVILLGVAQHGRRTKVIRLIPLIAVLSIGAVVTFGGANMAERFSRLQHGGEERLQVWRQSLHLMENRALTGIGSGGYQWYFPRHKTADISHSHYDHAHNDYVEMVVEYGLIGSLLWAAAMLLIWLAILRAYRRRRDPLMHGLAFAALCASTAFLLHAVVDFNFQIPANAVWFYTILAMGLSAALLPARRTRKRKNQRGQTRSKLELAALRSQ